MLRKRSSTWLLETNTFHHYSRIILEYRQNQKLAAKDHLSIAQFSMVVYKKICPHYLMIVNYIIIIITMDASNSDNNF